MAFLAHASGRTAWTVVSSEAETFGTIREATRAAMRMPARYRAFALPGGAGLWRTGK